MLIHPARGQVLVTAWIAEPTAIATAVERAAATTIGGAHSANAISITALDVACAALSSATTTMIGPAACGASLSQVVALLSSRFQ